MPKVSVVMCVYNGVAYLESAVRSILMQSFGDFELVIVDDGSTDTTPALLRKLAAEDSRVRVVHQSNSGVSRAGNRGIEVARAPLIARMDSDDISMPDRLQKQVEFMNAHSDVVLLGGAYDLIDGESRVIRTIHPPADDASLQEQCLVGTTPICHPLCMFRRDVALSVGGYDDSFPCALDLDLYLRLGEHGKMACLPDVLLQYRQHDKSISEVKQLVQVEYMARACHLAWERRKLSGIQFAGAAGWRADGSIDSQFRQHLKFGWWAYNEGRCGTARVYGSRAVRKKPFSRKAWTLLAKSLLCRSVRA